MRFTERLWLIFAVVSVSLVVAAGVSWIVNHPYGADWDEAQYFNQAQTDIRIFEVNGLGVRSLAKAFLLTDRPRPPAYRMLVIPFSYLLGFSPAKARLVSLAFFVLSLLFVYFGTRRIAGRVGSAFAVIFLCLCPEMISSCMVFYTEYPLYLATAAMLYFLCRSWDRQRESSGNWIGLGLSFGLGALAKTSFLLVGGPLLLLSFLISWRKIAAGPSIMSLFRAAVLGALIALPWWILNARQAFGLATYARNYGRHSLGPASLETWVHWLSQVAQSAIGLPLAVLSLLIIAVSILGQRDDIDTGKNRMQKTVMGVCFMAGMPLVLSVISSTNHSLRYMTPAIILFAAGLGVLVERTQMIRAPLVLMSSGVLFVVQLVMILVPAIHPIPLPLHMLEFGERPPWLVMARLEQWDLNQLREAARSYGFEKPSISLLGNGREFNQEQIMYQWLVHHEAVPRVEWLWRYEEGAIDWDKILKSINASDIVLTAVNYVGDKSDKQELDNQHNNEFAKRLESDSRFKGPIRIGMGRFESVDLVVFFNAKSLRQDHKQ